MVHILDIIAGVSIVIALGFIALYAINHLRKDASVPSDENEDGAFCDIDLDLLMMDTDSSNVKDLDALKGKIETFMQRNRFYKME